MSYSYQNEKAKLFTEKGQIYFLKARDEIHSVLETAGAFRFDKLKFDGVSCSWQMLAILDRLVELGEIERLERKNCWSQHQIYTSPVRDNY